MTTIQEYPPDRLTLDERHDRIIARLTQRLASAKQQRRAPTPTHDLLVSIAHPEFLDAALLERPRV